LIAAAISASVGFFVKAEVPHGIISIAFDDNYQNQFDYAFPSMQNYGIVGTFYAVTDHVGLPGYMNYYQLETLQSNGNEIGSHSKSHTTFSSLSEAEIRQECSLSKTALEDHGLTVTDFSYPNGVTNDTIDSIVSQYYRSGRTAYTGPYLMDIPTTQFRVAAFSAETTGSNTLSLLEDMVDQVYSTNGWAIIFFHNIIPNETGQQYTTSKQDFDSFLNYTVAKGVRTLTVNQALCLTSFSLTSNFGTVTPTSGIYNLGDSLTLEAFAPSAEEGERYVWLGWKGSGAGSYTGTDNPVTITLNGSVNQTALWRREFKLSIFSDTGQTSPSAGNYWYEVGEKVLVEAFGPSEKEGERYLWQNWKGTGSGSYSGSNTATSITMTGPITETTSWVHQYFVNASSRYGTVNGSGWYNAGELVYATLDQSVVGTSYGIRQLFTGWSEDSSGTNLISDLITVNGPKDIVASWKTQFLVIFNQTGIDSNQTASILVDSSNHELPFSIWVDEGTKTNYVYPDYLQDELGNQYILTFPLNQSSIEVNSPVTITGHYDLHKTQNDVQPFLAKMTPIVLVFLILFVATLTAVLVLQKRQQQTQKNLNYLHKS
jgi:peptidoglycan/xylan/chitin deacetylase (PgdA/CDA1 family)